MCLAPSSNPPTGSLGTAEVDFCVVVAVLDVVAVVVAVVEVTCCGKMSLSGFKLSSRSPVPLATFLASLVSGLLKTNLIRGGGVFLESGDF